MRPRDIFRRLPTIPAVAVAGAVVTLAMGAPSASSADDACQAKGSRTEEASRYARVYSVRRVQDDFNVRRWYGCLHSADRRVRLGTVGAGGIHIDSIEVRLAGRHVAAASQYTAATGDALGAVIEVRDMRTGRLKRRFSSPSELKNYDMPGRRRRTGDLPAFAGAQWRHVVLVTRRSAPLDRSTVSGHPSLR